MVYSLLLLSIEVTAMYQMGPGVKALRRLSVFRCMIGRSLK